MIIFNGSLVKDNQDVAGIIGTVVLTNSGVQARNNFSPNSQQFGHTRSQTGLPALS